MAQLNMNGVSAWESSGDPSIKEKNNKSNYSRFFINAFSEGEVEAILNDGGGEVFANFQTSARSHMNKKDYADRLLSPKFTGKDRVVRPSRYNRLSEKIWEKYFKQTDTRIIEYTRKVKDTEGKPTFRFYKSIRVTKGHEVHFKGKNYKAGQILPKNFYSEKNNPKIENKKE